VDFIRTSQTRAGHPRIVNMAGSKRLALRVKKRFIFSTLQKFSM
jgi:hypothetical protein